MNSEKQDSIKHGVGVAQHRHFGSVEALRDCLTATDRDFDSHYRLPVSTALEFAWLSCRTITDDRDAWTPSTRKSRFLQDDWDDFGQVTEIVCGVT